MLYVILPFYNEVKLLPTCLESLRWCDRVYAIDGRNKGHKGERPTSSDGSLEVCRKYENVTLLSMPDSDYPQKTTRGFEQATSRRDICMTLDADMRVTGDTQAFRADLEKRQTWKGAAGIRVFYQQWTRKPEFNGRINQIYRLINPYEAKCNPQNHGVYLKHGKILLPTFTSPYITIVHDDSMRDCTNNIAYSNQRGKFESAAWKRSRREVYRARLNQIKLRIMMGICPEFYPRVRL